MIDKIHINDFHSLIKLAVQRKCLNKIIQKSVRIDQQFAGHIEKIWKILEEKSTLDELTTIAQNLAKLPLQTGLTIHLNKKISLIEAWQHESLKFLAGGDRPEAPRQELITRGRALVSSDKLLKALEEVKHTSQVQSLTQCGPVEVNSQTYHQLYPIFF
jgi:hypothetical protein